MSPIDQRNFTYYPLIFDSYKDSAINIYEYAHNVSPKIKVVVGPFVHAMPEYSNRNPVLVSMAQLRWCVGSIIGSEMKTRAVTLWTNQILLCLFEQVLPQAPIVMSQWPIAQRRTYRMFMSKEQKLIEHTGRLSTTKEEGTKDNNNVDTLEYRPWIGFEGGAWLGGLTGDQRSFDKDCLIYESNLIEEKIEIAGFTNVSLQVKRILSLIANYFTE